ncbi:unnamed protein product [Ambrosiozyma monospora]|uniref:Unnamed protein product n=1 Tax=Ambrosiozyma monospora TaxID=43982 RepID=A0ACB5U1K6_AMBMO|nr:unnamed protein product [Ambrosiozyma monospora]
MVGRGWCNIACSKNPILRAVTIPAMIVVGQAVVTPLQQNLFPSSQAPLYSHTNGFYYSIGFTCVLIVWTGFVIPFCERKFPNSGAMTDIHRSPEDHSNESASSDA